MAIAILASVPCVHLNSALVTFSADAIVAFGTDARETFVDDEDQLIVAPGTPVMIYGSRRDTDGPSDLFRPGHATVSAIFQAWRRADANGKHPEGTRCRPPSTLDPIHGDAAFNGFWEVSNLRVLPHPVPFSAMRKYGSKQPFAKFFKPRRPIVVALTTSETR